MVRPHHFHPNPETAADKQHQGCSGAYFPPANWHAIAHAEVTGPQRSSARPGVRVHLFDDEDPHGSMGQPATPDSVFPNNWFSTHAGGHGAVPHVRARPPPRAARSDIIELLKAQYRVQRWWTTPAWKPTACSSEGTGRHGAGPCGPRGPATRSHRINPVALGAFAPTFGTGPWCFATADAAGQPATTPT